jgi:hypothetical protein
MSVYLVIELSRRDEGCEKGALGVQCGSRTKIVKSEWGVTTFYKMPLSIMTQQYANLKMPTAFNKRTFNKMTLGRMTNGKMPIKKLQGK